MFKFFKNEPTTTADQKLEQIIQMLFPPVILEEREGHKFHVDHSADSNLEAVLIDLEEGHNDIGVQNTIRAIADRLYRVREMLNVYSDMEIDANYYVINVTDEEIFPSTAVRTPDEI